MSRSRRAMHKKNGRSAERPLDIDACSDDHCRALPQTPFDAYALFPPATGRSCGYFSARRFFSASYSSLSVASLAAGAGSQRLCSRVVGCMQLAHSRCRRLSDGLVAHAGDGYAPDMAA